MFLDRFKKIVKGEKDEKKTTVKKVEEKSVVGKPALKSKDIRKSSVSIYEILKKPMVTEKGGLLGQSNKYLMLVAKNSNKFEIKKSVGALYNVTVESVNIVNIPPKKKQRGKTQGFKPGFKKAIITLKQGDKIESV